MQSIQSQTTEPSSIAIPDQKLNNLIQGRTYFPNYRTVVGSQYLTEELRVGETKLLGEVYAGLPFLYDIYTDDLILLDWQSLGYGRIRLNKEHIESFEFDNRLFINPNYNEYKSYDLKDKFYEVIGTGAVSLLINRQLQIRERSSVDYFIRNDSKILMHSDQIFKFKNKRTFLKSLPIDTKDDAAEYIRKNKISLKKAKDAEWIGLISYINELIRNKSEMD